MLEAIQITPEMIEAALTVGDVDRPAHFCSRDEGNFVIDGVFDLRLVARALSQARKEALPD